MADSRSFDSPKLEERKLVILNIPAAWNKDTVSNCLEPKLKEDVEVTDVKREDDAPGVALVTFSKPVDIFALRKKLFQGKTRGLEVDSVAVPRGVVLWNVLPSASKNAIVEALNVHPPREITLHPKLGALVQLSDERDVKDAMKCLQTFSKQIEPYYDTFHKEVFAQLLSSGSHAREGHRSSSRANEPGKRQGAGNLVICSIESEEDSEEENSPSAVKTTPQRAPTSNPLKLGDTTKVSTATRGQRKSMMARESGFQAPSSALPASLPSPQQGVEVKNSGEKHPLSHQTPAAKSSQQVQDTQSPRDSTVPKTTSVVVSGRKEKSETLNVGVVKLALLEKSKYFDELKQCQATRDRITGIITLTGSPGETVATMMGLKFKVGGIKTESFTVSPETAAALKSTSHQSWDASNRIHVDISASGSITCVALSDDDKQRTVEAVKSCISQLEGGKTPKTCQGEPPVVSQVERHFAASAQPDVQHDSRSQLWSSEISSWSLEEGTLDEKENQPRHAGNGGRNPQLTSRSPSGGRSQFPSPVTGNEAARTRGNRNPHLAPREAFGERSDQHRQSSNTLGESSDWHRQSSNTHGERSDWHRQSSNTLGEKTDQHHQSSSTHGEKTDQHHGSSSTHGEKTDQHCQSSSTYGEKTDQHHQSSSTYGEKTDQLHGSSSTHGERKVAASQQKTEQFHLTGIKARCFLRACLEPFKAAEVAFRADGGVWDMTQGADENELTVKLSGPQDKVTDAHRQLCSLAKRLWHEKISIEKDAARSKPIELALLARGLRGLENILDLCGGLERTNACYLEFLLPPRSADSSLAQIARTAPPAERSASSDSERASSSASPHRVQGHQGSRHQHRRHSRGSSRGQGQQSSRMQPNPNAADVFPGGQEQWLPWRQENPYAGDGNSPALRSQQSLAGQLQQPGSGMSPSHSVHGFARGPLPLDRRSASFDDFGSLPTASASSAKHAKQMTRVGSTDIVVKQGDIAKETADILVCVVGTSRKLEDSAVGQAFLKTGGSEFKQNFERSARDSEAGHIVISGGGGGLQCDYVITLVLHRYSSSSDKFLSSCLNEVLQMAVSFGATSVAMPAIGTGVRLAFPISLVASTSLQEAACLAQSHSPLRSITYVVYDDSGCQEFQQKLSMLKDGNLQVPNLTRTPSPPRKAFVKEKKSEDPPFSKSTPAASVGGEVTTWSQAHVRVYAATKDKCQAAVKAVTDRLRQDFLKKEFIQRRLVGTLRPSARKEVVEAARKEGVYVKFPEDRKKKQEIPKLTLQGEVKAVLKAQNAIQQLLEREKTAMGAQSSPLGPRPSHGTSEFLKFMASQGNHEVPSHWKCHQKGKTVLDTLLNFFKVDYSLQDVDGGEYQEVADVVMGTWRKDLVGKGADAKGLTHSSIRIKKIERLENLKLYDTYISCRSKMFLQALKNGRPFTKIEKLPNSSGPVLTTKYTKQLLSGEVLDEVNEYYLFHGTNAEVVKAICGRGVQTRLSSTNGMFGMGTYAAESSTKADQYADGKQNRTHGEKKMIMMRVLLGQPWLTDQPKEFKLPPCAHSGCHKEDCSHTDRFNSVVAHRKWLFREFVLYQEQQIYPEYVITYDRI